MIRRRMLVTLSALAPLGCGTLSASDVPAVIVAPTAATRAELARVVGEAANGAPVLLSDDALTRDSRLVVERRRPSGPEGRAITGRTLDEPLMLRLVLDGETCVLVREYDERRWALTETRCEPQRTALSN